MAQPTILSDLFPHYQADSRLTVEIGSGWGEYIVEHARHAPRSHQYLCVEHEGMRASSCARKVESIPELMGRVRVFHGPADILLRCLPHESVDSLITLYPDPWPKRRHRHKRLTSSTLLPLILSRLKKGGIWHFATDMESYADFVETTLHHLTGAFGDIVTCERKELTSTMTTPRTQFERRAFGRGFSAHELRISRNLRELPQEMELLKHCQEREDRAISLTVGQRL